MDQLSRLQSFNLPITATLTYTDMDIYGFSEIKLGLYYWELMLMNGKMPSPPVRKGSTRGSRGKQACPATLPPDGVWAVWEPVEYFPAGDQTVRLGRGKLTLHQKR